jgi:hypothetical protein
MDTKKCPPGARPGRSPELGSGRDRPRPSRTLHGLPVDRMNRDIAARIGGGVLARPPLFSGPRTDKSEPGQSEDFMEQGNTLHT